MPSSTTSRPETGWLPVAPELLLSLATGSLLVTILGTKALTQLLQELGQMSEEVFRGDRLPILEVSIARSSASDQDE